MTMQRRDIIQTALAVACLSLASCTTGHRDTAVTQVSPRMTEISSLYRTVTAHHRRPFRKPTRDRHDRALRLLSERTAVVLGEYATPNEQPHLTAARETETAVDRNETDSFHAALQRLKTAADNADLAAIRLAYADAMESYRRLH